MLRRLPPPERKKREERTAKATPEIQAHFNDKQPAFLEFVLSQYVKEGIDEFDLEKCTRC